MRKFVFSLLFFATLFLLVVGALAGQERLHPSLRELLAWASTTDSFDLATLASRMQIFTAAGMILPSQVFLVTTGEVEQVGVLVKVSRSVWGKRFLGLPVQISTGTILSMAVSLAELLQLAASPEVIYVEPAWRTSPKLDRSVPAIGADRVHVRTPPVVGRGVIIGAVDTGIDYTHLDFRYDADGDGFEESSRILNIWDQTSGFFGTYYSKAEIESDLAFDFGPGEGIVRQADDDGHGTHVMATAAGDGSSSGAGFVGVAPGAQLIAVKTPFYTSDILAGAAYIFERAEELGLPAVVNLSLGGHDGPHDGTSLFEQGLDELATAAGQVIVVSAGNEGDQFIHVSQTLNGDSSTFAVDPSSDSVDLTLWYPGGSGFTITVAPPSGEPLVVSAGFVGFANSGFGSAYVDNVSSGANPNNGDNEVLVMLSNLLPGNLWTITVRDDTGGGRFDAWITSGDGAILGGDSASTIDEPGNADRVITVGAFNTKAQWPSLSGEQDYSSQYPIGALSYFSSQGPTRDGRQKPEVAAPGAWVAAALSVDSPSQGYLTHPDQEHTMLAGTSISAPHVSGVAALMLSLNPHLSAEEIRAKLTDTAIRDSFTGSIPNTRFGWGKVDAEAAVAVVQLPPDDDGAQRPVIAVAQNPAQDDARFTYDIPDGAISAALRIYSITGRLVFETALTPHASEYVWDLVTNRGKPLANGLYLYVLVTEAGSSETGRLVIER